ncbi:hypothetical protein [Mycobacterium interjectum]|uniref:hypothetical protein n=1 Tax=Mycobacterium interjectum TaxID=33895 RepID=UPI000BDF480F|nr:hypothetical protein [Mycobacterium interjectum]MCV7089452.1 hypothetical protein [Mycobacterium interjectum]
MSGFDRDQAAWHGRGAVFALRVDGDTGVCTRLHGHDGPCAGYAFKISEPISWPNGLPRTVTVTDIAVVRAAHDATPTPALRALARDLARAAREAAGDGDENHDTGA